MFQEREEREIRENAKKHFLLGMYDQSIQYNKAGDGV